MEKNYYQNTGKKSSSRKTITILVGVLILLVLVAIAIIAIQPLKEYVTNLVAKDIAQDVDYQPVDVEPVERIDESVENILLIGLDVRKEGSEAGRNDLTMVLTLDRKNKKIRIASILRDSYVPIKGHDENRINTAYRFGGPGLTINTVNKVFGLDIQRYVKVDFFGLAKIIDAMGGIDVDEISSAEATQIRKYCYDENTTISSGKNLHLNGAEAVAYGRIRKMDSDFKRTDRQREVFKQLAKKALDMDKTELLALIKEHISNVSTNFNEQELVDFATSLITVDFDKKIEELQVPVEGSFKMTTKKGASVISLDIEENKKALEEFIYGK